MAAVLESRQPIVDKLGIDTVVRLLSDPETEIAAAAATLLGNLAQDGTNRRDLPDVFCPPPSHECRIQTSTAT